MSDDQIRKRICFKDVPISFLYLLKYFVDKYEVRESIFSRFRGSSRNHPKSIAIDQESLISHLGIIEIPQNLTITLQRQAKQQQHVFAVFWTLLDPVLGKPSYFE